MMKVRIRERKNHEEKSFNNFSSNSYGSIYFDGCSGVADIESDYDTESKNLQSMFVVVERCECWNVVYDKNTKVMYAVSDGAENRGTFYRTCG